MKPSEINCKNEKKFWTHLEEYFVHDKNGSLPQVSSTRGRQRQYIVCEVASKVGSHETSKTVQRKTRVVEIGRGDVFSDHVGGEHDYIDSIVKTLGGSEVPCPLGGGGG